MKLILFARYSVIQCLILFPEIKKAKKIQFQSILRSNDIQPVFFQRLTSKLIRFINRECIIEEFNKEIFNDEVWVANRDAMNLISIAEKKYKKNSLIKYLEKIMNSEKVLKYFQGVLSYFLPSFIVFDKVLIQMDQNEDTLCLHAWEVTESVEKKIGVFRASLLKFIYKIHNASLYILYLIIILFFPLIYLVYRLMSGYRRGYISNYSYTLAMPILWGFKTGSKNIRSGVVKQIDDTYLYGEGLESGSILHVFGKWHIRSEIKEKYKTQMMKQGYKYIDKDDFKLNNKLILIILKTQFKVIFFIGIAIFGLSSKRESVVLSKSLIKALYYYFEKYLEITNIKYKAELIKNDYNPGHVIDSIVLEKSNIKSFGVQHAGTPYDVPQLNFVNFDYYSIWGNFYAKAFQEGWSKINLLKSGRELIDDIVLINNDKVKVKAISDHLNHNYGETKYRVSFLFSSPTYLTKKTMWIELYNGFLEISKLTIDFQLICRFREDSHKNHPYIKDIFELIANDSRFILEQQDFTTQELMTVSDLVITSNTSFGINEALVINKKVYTFDLMGNANLTLGEYGEKLVINSSEKLINVIKGLEDNFYGLDYDVESLTHDLNYFSDGMNCKRLREKIINETTHY